MSKKIIFIIFIFSSCHSNINLIGTYKTYTPSIFKIVNSRFFLINSTLELKENNQYKFVTCAQTENGNWWKQHDSLFLKCENVIFNVDSFNYLENYNKGNICQNEPRIFIVDGNKMKNSFIIRNRKFYIYLKKK